MSIKEAFESHLSHVSTNATSSYQLDEKIKLYNTKNGIKALILEITSPYAHAYTPMGNGPGENTAH